MNTGVSENDPEIIRDYLLKSIRQGRLQRVKYMVEHLGLQCTEKRVRMAELVMEAVEYQRECIVRYLLKLGADVCGLRGDTPLHRACIKGNVELVTLLLNFGANIDATDSQGRIPLHFAVDWREMMYSGIREGKRGIICYYKHLSCNVSNILINHGSKVNNIDYTGQSPLHMAARCSNDSVLPLLIQHGSNIDIKDDYGRTALHYGVFEGDQKIVRRLLQAGASTDSFDSYFSTVLHKAVKRSTEMTRLILDSLDHNGLINKKDIQGLSPLHLAVSKKDLATVRLLINNGADVDQENIEGSTPLLWACHTHHDTLYHETYQNCISCSVITVLLEEDADTNHASRAGSKAIHIAATKNLVCTAKLLFDRGVSVNDKDAEGKSPLHLAIEHGHSKLCEVIREYGADIESKDMHGRTPLHMLSSVSANVTVLLQVLSWDPDLNIKDNNNESLLSKLVLYKSDHFNFIIALLEHGANLLSDPSIDSFMSDRSNVNTNIFNIFSLYYIDVLKEFQSHLQTKTNEFVINETALIVKELKSAAQNALRISYFDLFNEDIHSLAHRIRINQHLAKFCQNLFQRLTDAHCSCEIGPISILNLLNSKKFTVFKNLLKNRLETIIKRSCLLNNGYNLFEYLQEECSLPRLALPCIDYILKHLSNNDLWNLR